MQTLTSELLSRLKGIETLHGGLIPLECQTFGTTIPFEGNGMAVSYRLSAVRKENYSDMIHIMPTLYLPFQLNRIGMEGWRSGRMGGGGLEGQNSFPFEGNVLVI